jgi:hypothetical protein
MRWLSLPAAALLVVGHVGVITCDDDYHHHHHDDEDDVTVEVTGVAGVAFDARFEDERQAQTIAGVVPFSADFERQQEFFKAAVDKNSGGAELICVRITSSLDTRQSCTNEPHGHVSVTVTF